MNLIGQKVIIKTKDSWAYGEWGTIVAVDGETIFVSIADDDTMVLEFSRKELKFIK